MDDNLREIFIDVSLGDICSPRGQKIVELNNFMYELDPYERFTSFEARNLSLKYIKKEFLWYLKGDKFDTSITDHANMWKSLIFDDGSISSNYGQYIFGKENQFDCALNQLKNDKDTRRASMVILSNSHVQTATNDLPCTYAINFRIRNNKVHMTVHMRAQDAIFGMANDAPAFSFIHEMMFNSLKEFYPEVEYGQYVHFADSFHVYERHFKMLEEITGINPETKLYDIQKGGSKLLSVDCPKISGYEEVKFLRRNDFTNIPEKYKFSKWLNS